MQATSLIPFGTTSKATPRRKSRKPVHSTRSFIVELTNGKLATLYIPTTTTLLPLRRMDPSMQRTYSQAPHPTALERLASKRDRLASFGMDWHDAATERIDLNGAELLRHANTHHQDIYMQAVSEKRGWPKTLSSGSAERRLNSAPSHLGDRMKEDVTSIKPMIYLFMAGRRGSNPRPLP